MKPVTKEFDEIRPYHDDEVNDVIDQLLQDKAFQFVDSGNAGAGLVALSQLTRLPATSYWLIPENLYTPIEQHGILLSSENPTAINFVNYLQSPPARALIAQSGYRLP